MTLFDRWVHDAVILLCGFMAGWNLSVDDYVNAIFLFGVAVHLWRIQGAPRRAGRGLGCWKRPGPDHPPTRG